MKIYDFTVKDIENKDISLSSYMEFYEIPC